METILPQLFKLLVEPPGNLIYHLVLVFASLAALQAVSLLDDPENHHMAVRMRVGLLTILAAQVLLFGISALGWQNLIDTRTVLPPLDRAVIAVTLLWLGWMTIFPDKNKIADWTVALLTLAVAVFFFYSLTEWSRIVGQVHFNNTPLDFSWATIFLAISLFCGVLVVFFRHENWGISLGIFVIIFLGSIVNLTTPVSESDYPAALRLALICVFPLLPGLAHNLKRDHLPGSVAKKTRTLIRRNDFRTALAWSLLTNITDQHEAASAWVKALGHSVSADKCVLITRSDENSLISVQYGWNLLLQQPIQARDIDQDSLPNINNIFRHGDSLYLSAAETGSWKDQQSLAAILGGNVGHNILATPISITENGWSGILALVSPERREWTQEDAYGLKKLARETYRYISTLPAKQVPAKDQKNVEDLLEKSKSEIQNLREERRLLLEELDAMRVEQDASSMSIDADSLLAVQEEMHKTIISLEAENESLRKKLMESPSPPADDDYQYLEQELRTALEETAHLQNALAEASITIMNLQQRSSNAGVLSEEMQQSLIKTIHKMYGPISSVMAYTNMLSGESTEKLEPVQQNFFERIHNSTEQLKALMDELVRSAEQTASPIELAPQPVFFDAVIDRAVGDTSPILTAKNINMQIALPDDLPQIYADRDALQQIVTHLLQNAACVTPNGGKIEVQAEIDNLIDDESYFIFRVTDEGGGIPPDEIGKIFNKEYRADHPTISGINDSGTGLTITRTLVEAHNGRIWVETNQPGTSTFIVILPLENRQPNGFNQDL